MLEGQFEALKPVTQTALHEIRRRIGLEYFGLDAYVDPDGKVVVFSFSGGSTGNSANGAIYYVEDTTAGAGQSWSVTLIGTMSGTSATIAQIASSSVFL